MGLKKINNRMFYYPHQPETDRPMLAYLKGNKVALAIDAGNSADHVDEFYIENIDCNYCILSHTEPLTKPDLLNYLKTL